MTREYEPFWDDPLHDMRQEVRRQEREDDTEMLRRESAWEDWMQARDDARADARFED